VLGRHDDRLGQLDDLIAHRAPNDALLAGQLAPALATACRPMLDRLIGIIDHPACAALMAGLAALLAPRTLARRALGALAAVAGRRQRAVARVLTQPPLEPGLPLLLGGDPLILRRNSIKQRQHHLLGRRPTRPSDPGRLVASQFHAP
jgi:hypothetical protein